MENHNFDWQKHNMCHGYVQKLCDKLAQSKSSYFNQLTGAQQLGNEKIGLFIHYYFILFELPHSLLSTKYRKTKDIY